MATVNLNSSIRPLEYHGGVIAVAVGASVSWICCTCLIVYICWSVIQSSRKRAANSDIQRLAFLRTQFGLLFINLLIGDFLQSTGFALEYHWLAIDKFPNQLTHGPVCSMQAGFVQAGDLASAIWSLLIAIHTSCYILARYKPSSRVVKTIVPLVWLFVLALTFVGPIHVAVLRRQGKQAASFYNNAGLWCWISLEYDKWRLYVHYLFVFISAFGSLASYLTIFLFLWFRLFQRGAYNHTSLNLRRAVDGRIVPTSPSIPVSAQSENHRRKARADKGAEERNRKMDRAALMMLLFPLTYICSILPLATFRLARISTNPPWARNPKLQATFGCIFALGGFWNALLYAVTRNIFRSNTTPSEPGTSNVQMSEVVTATNTEPTSQQVQQHRGSVGSTGIFPIHLRRGSGTSSQAGKKRSSGSLRRPSSQESLASKNSSSFPAGQYQQQQIAAGVGRPGLPRRPSGLSNVVRYNDGLSFEDSSEEEISATDIVVEDGQVLPQREPPHVQQQDIPQLAVQSATPMTTRYSFEGQATDAHKDTLPPP